MQTVLLNGRQGLLERVHKHRAADGSVLVISAEAIRDRTGARWPAKCEVVWGFTEREFQKNFSPADQIARLDDVHYLLMQPPGAPLAAQGRALNLLREVVEFFLGSSTLGDLRVATVSGATEDGLDISFLSPEQLEAAATSIVGAPYSAEEDDCEPPAGAVWRKSAPAVPSIDGFITQPIWAVQKAAVVSYRLVPIAGDLSEGDLHLSSRAAMQVDLAVLEQALKTLEEGPDLGFGVQFPIQFRTLNSVSSRLALCSRMATVDLRARRRLIPCIEGVEAGVPRSVLETAVAALRTVAASVVIRAPPLGGSVAGWSGAKVSAIVLDLSDLGASDHAELPQVLQRFAPEALAVAPGLIAQSVTSRAQVLAAWAAGFTHVAGDVLLERQSQLTAYRFGAVDLYASVG